MIESARPISGSRDMAADGRPDASTRSPLQTLARQAAGLSWSSIPAEVQDRTLLVLFDSLGVARDECRCRLLGERDGSLLTGTRRGEQIRQRTPGSPCPACGPGGWRRPPGI